MKYFNQGIRHIILGILFFFYSINGESQTQLFSGELSAGRFTGTAEYPFEVVEGDSIPVGSFLMYKANLNALLQEKDSFFSISGAFNEGYPEGFWKFQFGEFISNRSSQVVGYQYRVNASGIQHDALGNLTAGKPDGDWVYKISRVENSEVSEELFKSKITFEQGVPQKSFQIENDSITLVGRFLRDGFAHDLWAVYSDVSSESSENWHFDNGLLEKIEKISPNGNMTLEIFDTSAQSYKSEVLDERYLKIVKWYIKEQQADLNSENMGMYRLLRQNAQHYQSINAFFNDLGKSQFMPSFKVRLPFYSLDSLETKQIREIVETYRSASKTSKTLLGNPQLELLVRSNTEANYYYNVVKRLQSNFLEPLGAFISYYDQQTIEFLPRTTLTRQIWPNGLPKKKIQMSNQAGSNAFWDLESFPEYEAQAMNMANVQNMAKYVESSLDSISESMSEWLKKAKKQQQFLTLDELLVKETQLLENNIDTLLATDRLGIQRALNGILATKETTLKTYAEMPESDEKLDYGQNVLTCLQNLGELASAVSKLPEQERIIKEAYQDAFWNPFTATIMDEDVKKRITAAHKNILIPYVLDLVDSPTVCEEAPNILQLINDIQTRLLELRDEPTKKLERKLRKEQDPESVLELLGIMSNIKTAER
ncbi:hypothetical protein ACOKFD_15420 [Flagellimonas sp. S174]|uniref:hypothetical protein n=1 Tax=Flagellimonas sp. S174 TaxID=3410790 RepID=UPI003BF465A1